MVRRTLWEKQSFQIPCTSSLWDFTSLSWSFTIWSTISKVVVLLKKNQLQRYTLGLSKRNFCWEIFYQFSLESNSQNSQYLLYYRQPFQNLGIQGAIFSQISNKFGLERYSHILIWCGRIFIKGRMCNRKCRKECSFTKLVYPFNNEMI